MRAHHYRRPSRDRSAQLFASCPDGGEFDTVGDGRRRPSSPRVWPFSSFRVRSMGRRGDAVSRKTLCRYWKKLTEPVGEGRQQGRVPPLPIQRRLGWHTRDPRGRVSEGCHGQGGRTNQSRLGWRARRQGARCGDRCGGVLESLPPGRPGL